MQFIEKVKLISAHRYCSCGRDAEWKSAKGLALIAASEDMNGYQRDMLPDWVQGLRLYTNWSPSRLIFHRCHLLAQIMDVSEVLPVRVVLSVTSWYNFDRDRLSLFPKYNTVHCNQPPFPVVRKLWIPCCFFRRLSFSACSSLKLK